MTTVEVMKGLGPDVRTIKLNGHVGFDSLPDQLVNKHVAQGFSFNIMCIGETGLGKSTLIETLFNQRFEFTPSSHEVPQVKLKPHTYDLKEGSVKLKLTIIETSGFGDQVNKEDSSKPIIDYINQQFENFLQEELKIKRSLHTYHDTRVHVCLYFIAPTGHSLKSIDMVTMKKLDSRVNIIPVIAKSDTITKPELQRFKTRIQNEIANNDIHIYQFPTDDETVSEQNSIMKNLVPFAVVGSSDEITVNGRKSRARQYPWGAVLVDSEAHCDFVRLREAMLRVNMDDLRERTHAMHYEHYRRQRLAEMGFSDEDKLSLQEMYEKRRETHQAELQRKEEEMRQMFVVRVKEKEQELKKAEGDLQTKFEAVKKQHADEKRKLEEKRQGLDEEIAEFQRRKTAADNRNNLASGTSFTLSKSKKK
ncbi:hypothetical protein BOX15_Mlig024017g1 [Macrostomum lignano]|uniref:Septin n=2 Tax=Macrostomum lignano TaxID=282301 RepID=A0A1I8J606_9PLAT|nr:hypothetical protein BOX15_Mlig024017g1 [Macrostomum lignano]